MPWSRRATTASWAAPMSATSSEEPSTARASATTPTTPTSARDSSPRASRSSSTSSSPTSRRAWVCTGSKPTSSRRTFDPPASFGPSGSSMRGSPRNSSISRAVTAAAPGVTTTATPCSSSDWPAVPYRHASVRRLVAVVAGPPAIAPTGLAPQLAVELGVPLYSVSKVETPAVLFELLRSSPVGGVVEGQAGRTRTADGARACRGGPRRRSRLRAGGGRQQARRRRQGAQGSGRLRRARAVNGDRQPGRIGR